MTSRGTVAKYLSSPRESEGDEEGLRFLGFPLEVRIGNDAPTFNTAHLAGLVFLLRDAIGDQTTVCTGAGRAHWEGLWGLSWFFEVHGASPGRHVGIASGCAVS